MLQRMLPKIEDDFHTENCRTRNSAQDPDDVSRKRAKFIRNSVVMCSMYIVIIGCV